MSSAHFSAVIWQINLIFARRPTCASDAHYVFLSLSSKSQKIFTGIDETRRLHRYDCRIVVMLRN
jgi:hypothetical protein